MTTTKALTLAALALLSINALAADASGKWKGKMQLNQAALKANVEKQFAGKIKPEQKKQFDEMFSKQMATMVSGVVTLELRKDGTYTINLPAGVSGPQPRTENGTWKQSGNKVVMTEKPKAGKPGQPDTSNATLSPNGKSLVIDVEAEMARRGAAAGPGAAMMKGTAIKMVFSR